MSEGRYRPSWVDRLTASVERLPSPPWLTYLVAASAWTAIFIGVQVQQGAYQNSGFNPWHLFVATQPFVGIVGVHYLDRLAIGAFERFRAVMSGSEADADSALYRLTTLPARQVMIASILGLLFVLVQILLSDRPGESLNVASTSFSLTVTNVSIVIAWIGYAVLMYHGYHQLRVIDWLFRSKARIDPFYPQPLYALSEITSSTAILILAVTYGWLASRGGASLTGLGLFTIVGVPAIGVFIFVSPLWGAHRLLVDAKNEALKKNAAAYKTAMEELHAAIASRQFDEIDIWQKALAAIGAERRHAERLATWPWSPGAVRNFVGALLVPVIVWIIQYALQELIQ